MSRQPKSAQARQAAGGLNLLSVAQIRANVRANGGVIADDPSERHDEPVDREAILRHWDQLPESIKNGADTVGPFECPDLVAALLEIKI